MRRCVLSQPQADILADDSAFCLSLAFQKGKVATAVLVFHKGRYHGVENNK